MMKFRIIAKAVTQLLGDSAQGRFTVTGYEGQTKAASEVRGKKRNVQILFSQGDFPKGSGRGYGATDHQMVFTLGFTVSAASTCNLAVLNADPPPPAPAIAATLTAMQDAAAVAGDLMDEFFELVYQILMDGGNIDLGLPVGTVTDRWVATLKKDNPLPMGALLVLTGEAQYTCRTSEDVTGDTGAGMTDGVGVVFDFPGDALQRTELQVGASTDLAFDDGQRVRYDDGAPVLVGAEVSG